MLSQKLEGTLMMGRGHGWDVGTREEAFLSALSVWFSNLVDYTFSLLMKTNTVLEQQHDKKTLASIHSNSSLISSLLPWSQSAAACRVFSAVNQGLIT